MGIGAGFNGKCGDVTITTGVNKVTAKGSSADTTVGFTNNKLCGKITIGGTVYFDGTNYQNDGENYLRKSPLVFP